MEQLTWFLAISLIVALGWGNTKKTEAEQLRRHMARLEAEYEAVTGKHWDPFG